MKLLKKNFLIFIFFRKSDAFIFLNSLRKQDLSLLTKKGIHSLLNSKPQHNLQIYFEFIFNIQVSQP